MGLLDIFKSGRQRSRQSAREYSLASARQSIIYLATSAEDQDIREAALSHIRDNLPDILKNRYRSLDQLTRYVNEVRLSNLDPAECKKDQEFLLWVTNEPFCSSKDKLVAIKQLADQEKLKDIVIDNDGIYSTEICLAAISGLLDLDLVMEVAFKARDDNKELAQKVFELIPVDREKFLRLVNRAASPSIRLLAVNNIDDKKLLGKIAIRNTYSEIRLSAMKRITDVGIFNRVANQDDDPRNRKYALKKVNDQKVISKVASYDDDISVRIKAIKLLNDKILLRNLAKNESDWDIRETAAARLKDEEVMNEINSLKKVIEKQENDKYQQLKEKEIERAKPFFSKMRIVSLKKTGYNDSYQKGSIADILDEFKKHDGFYQYNPSENWQIISRVYENDCASFTINVRNYMADSGWIYNDYTFLIIERIGEDEFIWYQEKETRESN